MGYGDFVAKKVRGFDSNRVAMPEGITTDVIISDGSTLQLSTEKSVQTGNLQVGGAGNAKNATVWGSSTFFGNPITPSTLMKKVYRLTNDDISGFSSDKSGAVTFKFPSLASGTTSSATIPIRAFSECTETFASSESLFSGTQVNVGWDGDGVVAGDPQGLLHSNSGALLIETAGRYHLESTYWGTKIQGSEFVVLGSSADITVTLTPDEGEVSDFTSGAIDIHVWFVDASVTTQNVTSFTAP